MKLLIPLNLCLSHQFIYRQTFTNLEKKRNGEKNINRIRINKKVKQHKHYRPLLRNIWRCHKRCHVYFVLCQIWHVSVAQWSPGVIIHTEIDRFTSSLALHNAISLLFFNLVIRQARMYMIYQRRRNVDGSPTVIYHYLA